MELPFSNQSSGLSIRAVQHKRYCRLAALACVFLPTVLRENGLYKLRLPN